MAVEKKIVIDTNQATANVGKLANALDNATKSSDNLGDSLKDTTKDANSMGLEKATTEVGNLGASFEQAQAKAETFRVQTDNVQKISAGLQGGFQMAVGAMALFGDESEELTQIMLKLTAVMTITNSLKAVGEGFAALGNYIKLASAEGKLFNNVMKASIIGAVAAAVLYLVNNFDDLRKRFKWVDTAATALTKTWNGLMGVFENGIDVLKGVGTVVLKSLVAPIKTYIDTLKGVGKIIKSVFEGDFDSIPAIVEETKDDIAKNFTEIGDAANDLGKTVGDSFNKGIEDAAKTNKKVQTQMTDEEKAAAEERRKAAAEAAQKRLEDQQSIQEELRRSQMDAQQKELDDIDKWYKEAQEKAHENAEILAQIEEEKNKRVIEVNERYKAESRQNELDLESAKNEYLNGSDNMTYLQEQLRIEQEKLALIDANTEAWYRQAIAVGKLEGQIAEMGDTFEEIPIEEKISNMSGYMSGFAVALNDMFGAMMDGMDENSDEYKALAITQTIITTLVGMMNALSGCFTTKSGPWDIALAATQAAAILAGGIATISQITSANENTNLAGAEASIVSGTKVSENAVQGVTGMDSQSLPSVQGDSQSSANDNKVYVVTTDINKKQSQLSNKKTQVRF